MSNILYGFELLKHDGITNVIIIIIILVPTSDCHL